MLTPLQTGERVSHIEDLVPRYDGTIVRVFAAENESSQDYYDVQWADGSSGFYSRAELQIAPRRQGRLSDVLATSARGIVRISRRRFAPATHCRMRSRGVCMTILSMHKRQKRIHP